MTTENQNAGEASPKKPTIETKDVGSNIRSKIEGQLTEKGVNADVARAHVETLTDDVLKEHLHTPLADARIQAVHGEHLDKAAGAYAEKVKDALTAELKDGATHNHADIAKKGLGESSKTIQTEVKGIKTAVEDGLKKGVWTAKFDRSAENIGKNLKGKRIFGTVGYTGVGVIGVGHGLTRMVGKDENGDRHVVGGALEVVAGSSLAGWGLMRNAIEHNGIHI